MIYSYFCEGTTLLPVLKTYAKKTLRMVTKNFTLLPMLQKSQPIHKTVCARNIIVLSMRSSRLRSLTQITNFFEKSNRTPKKNHVRNYGIVLRAQLGTTS